MPKGNPNPVQTTEFLAAQIKRSDGTTESLAAKQVQVRLPITIDAAIAKLGEKKTAWLRRVITEAAERELMGDGQRRSQSIAPASRQAPGADQQPC
jgi:hypothetical protein